MPFRKKGLKIMRISVLNIIGDLFQWDTQFPKSNNDFENKILLQRVIPVSVCINELGNKDVVPLIIEQSLFRNME